MGLTIAMTLGTIALLPGDTESKILNNLVTELICLEALPSGSQRLRNLDRGGEGWVHFSCTVRADAGTPVTVSLDGQVISPDRPVRTWEAMRFVARGRHPLRVVVPEGNGVDRLIVRAIPELVYSKFGSDPLVREYGKYDWEFLNRHVLPNINVMVGNGDPSQKAFAEAWKRQGKRWMVECGVPGLGDKDTVTADQAYGYWSKNPGMVEPILDGVIADEFFGTNTPKYAAWTEAVRRIAGNSSFKGKRFYPYATPMYGAKASRGFIQTVLDAGYAFAYERYLAEERSETAARSRLANSLAKTIRDWQKAQPQAVEHMIICMGTFSQPPESLDVNPSTNLKVFLDMQMNLLANDPTCRGLYGVMTYLSSYTEEETVRWMGKLFRHYAIEGHREPFTRDPYILPHIVNPDFEAGLTGWQVTPAEPGTIAARSMDGFSWLQGRYPQTKQGNAILWLKRSAVRPNVISQRIRSLEPGRLYSLRMFSGDFKDMSTQGRHAVSIVLTGVDLLPGKVFQHVFANCYSHHHGPYNDSRKAWMNYHWRVFRARGDQAELRISDWAAEGTPGAPAGQELMLNFVQVQPYLSD